MKNYGGWALITGASSGLGRAFARELARNGVNCLLVGLGADALNAVRGELTANYGIECRPLELDLTGSDAMGALDAFVGDTPVGVLVNNAGIGCSGRFSTRDPIRLERLIRLNCLVPVMLTRRYLPQMLDRGAGAVIIVSSLQAFISCPFAAPYSGSKSFLLHFGESLWGELRSTPVDCITVCPAGMRTDFFASQGMPEKDCRSMSEVSVPPEEIAQLTLRRLGKGPLAVPRQTRLVSLLARLMPRSWVTLLSKRVSRKLIDMESL